MGGDHAAWRLGVHALKEGSFVDRNATMKACKDCKFLQIISTKEYDSVEDIPEGYLICRPPKEVVGFDVVYGVKESPQYVPRSARLDDTLCGRDAKWFKQA